MPPYDQALPGHFYAVGVGPGAPDLLTLRAARIIASVNVIVAPRSRLSTESLALETVRPLLDRQEIYDHVYEMQRDITQTTESWRRVAQHIATCCDNGQSVAQLTIGDPLLYSTSCYLVPLVLRELPEERVHIVPGISAFQAVASRIGETLTIQEDRLLLMPGTDLSEVERALDRCETLVLYKAGKQVAELVELFRQRGVLERARLVWYAEQGDREQIVTDLSRGPLEAKGYMATIIVHLGRRPWSAD